MLRKVVNLKVYDFDSFFESSETYVKFSRKNQLGYIYQNNYYWNDILIYQSPDYDNVDGKGFYFVGFHFDVDQVSSLNKRIRRIHGDMTEVSEVENDESVSVFVNYSDGSTLSYHGKNRDEFYDKVLKLSK